MLRLDSIVSRTIFLHVVALVVTATLLPLALYWHLESDVTDLQHRAMQERAESLARLLSLRPDGGWLLDLPAELRDFYSEDYGRYFYAVLDDTGKVLFSSRKDGSTIFPTRGSPAEAEFPEVSSGGRKVSGASVRKTVDGRIVRVQVGEDLAHRDVLIDDVLANFFQRVGWITAPILLVLLATDIVIFRRAVRPLLLASRRAEQIGPTRTDVRLPIDDIPREIRPLVIAVNRALDRLEEGFRRQREFTADAAHELRTPLAVLRTRMETLPDRSVASALLRDVEGMSRVVSQLLDAAELETFVPDPGETADLQAVCAQVAEFIAPLALAQGKTVALTGAEEPVWIKGDADMLNRAVRNLVENGLNQTPEGLDVEIAVAENGTVGVLDRGEGVPAADRERIFQPFWPRDRRRTGGAGLGLSIVKRIVEAHGGTVSVDDRPGGGAAFTLRFARATLLRRASRPTSRPRPAPVGFGERDAPAAWGD